MVTSVVTNTTPIRTRPQPPGGASSRWPNHRRRCAHRRCNTPAHRGADRASIRQRYRTVRMDGPAHHPASGRCWHRSGRHPALDHGSAAAGATRRTDVAAGSHRRRHLRRRILRSCSGSRVRVRRTRDVGCRRLTGHGRDCSWHGATCDRHSLHGQLPWCPERRAAAAINTPPAIRAIPHHLRNRAKGPASSAVTGPAMVTQPQVGNQGVVSDVWRMRQDGARAATRRSTLSVRQRQAGSCCRHRRHRVGHRPGHRRCCWHRRSDTRPRLPTRCRRGAHRYTHQQPNNNAQDQQAGEA
jgi:hypothetical protein